jgi:hypothetical protein
MQTIKHTPIITNQPYIVCLPNYPISTRLITLIGRFQGQKYYSMSHIRDKLKIINIAGLLSPRNYTIQTLYNNDILYVILSINLPR